MKSKLHRLKKNRHMLYVLKNAKPKLRKAILSNVDDDVIHTINEIAYNTLNNNNPINHKTKSILKKYKSPLRCLACHKKSIASKKKILVQQGNGFLPVLIGTVLSGVIGKLLSKE